MNVSSFSIPTGEIVAGKFRIEKVLGRGGNGTVVLATHLQLDERVALKFLEGPDAEQVADTARATVRLKSDHIVRVSDIGRHGAVPYVVMEYLEGKDLESIIAESGPLEDPAEAVELILQVSEAVAEAHRAGIVHRDIKLANLFLVSSRTGLPRLKLLDFGIARGNAGATNPQAIVGTPHYLAPERLLGIDDDPRSDVWALGIALHELMTGHKPFAADNTVALIAEILEKHHSLLSDWRPGLPEKLQTVIDRCLSKDPEARFQSAGELASALASFAPVRAQVHVERALEYGRPPPPPSSTPAIESARRTLANSSRALRASRTTNSGAASTRSLTTSQTAVPKSNSRGLFVVAIVAVLTIGGIVAGVLFVLRAPPPDAPARPTAATATPTASEDQAWLTLPAETNATPPVVPVASVSGLPVAPRPPSALGRPPSVAAPRPSSPGPASQPAPAPAPHALEPPSTNMAPAPAPPGRPTMEADPWKASNKQKLDDLK